MNDNTQEHCLSEDHPLWCINEQIKGLLEGDGASEDHAAVISFLSKTGLPTGTVRRLHTAIVCAETPNSRSENMVEYEERLSASQREIVNLQTCLHQLVYFVREKAVTMGDVNPELIDRASELLP